MPSIVSGVSVENLLSGRRFLVEWDLNPSVEGVTIYQIWRSTTELTGFTKMAQIQTPTAQYIDKVPFTFGVTFFYKVVAVNTSGVMSDITAASAVSDVTFDNFDEEPFRATSLTFDSFVANEVAAGVVDGFNLDFQTANLYRLNSLEVFVNGVHRLATEFIPNVDQMSFAFTFAPTVGSVVTVNYLKV